MLFIEPIKYINNSYFEDSKEIDVNSKKFIKLNFNDRALGVAQKDGDSEYYVNLGAFITNNIAPKCKNIDAHYELLFSFAGLRGKTNIYGLKCAFFNSIKDFRLTKFKAKMYISSAKEELRLYYSDPFNSSSDYSYPVLDGYYVFVHSVENESK